MTLSKKPIALNIICEKVNKYEYKLASEDMELIFLNCFEYHPHNTSDAKAGMRLQAFSYSGLKTWTSCHTWECGSS